MIANENLKPILQDEVVKEFLLEFPMKPKMCGDIFILYSDRFFITIFDALIENYLAIELYEIATGLTISGSVLLGICFDRMILDKNKLNSWNGIDFGDASIFLSDGKIKLRNLHSNFIALKLMFREIQKNGLGSLESGSDSLPGIKGSRTKFDPVNAKKYLTCIFKGQIQE